MQHELDVVSTTTAQEVHLSTLLARPPASRTPKVQLQDPPLELRTLERIFYLLKNLSEDAPPRTFASTF